MEVILSQISVKYVIDRFEGYFAACEKDDRTMVNIKRSILPPIAKEGDVLLIQGDTVTIDLVETARRKTEANPLMEELWRRSEKP